MKKHCMRDSTLKDNQSVRVRFAPSPTGSLHIGSVRTALFNWLFARKRNGLFFLRIEDTDQKRSRQEFQDQIIDSLKWCGLDWDHDIVRQSERLDDYCAKANDLVESQQAYISSDGSGAIYFRVPHKEVIFYDLIHEKTVFNTENIEDFVIMKSDGFPTWLFACVVDDSAFGITHVIRGDDHLSNTPRQILLYEAFREKIPIFAHLPLICGNDGAPLSKRDGLSGLIQFRECGYAAHGLLNYLALLGWAPATNQEFFRLDDLQEAFSLKRVSKKSAIFDEDKLNHINTLHLKALNREEYLSSAHEFFQKNQHVSTILDGIDFEALLVLYKERIRYFSEIYKQADYCFTDQLVFDKDGVCAYYTDSALDEHFIELSNRLQRFAVFEDINMLEKCVRECAESFGIKPGELIHPLRLALTGKMRSPGIFEVMHVLGREKVLARIINIVDNRSEIINNYT